MPRFLFHIIGADQATPLCRDLPDFEAAQREALKTTCQLVAEDSDAFWSAGEWQMVVTDASGLVLFTLQMHSTVAPVAMGRGLSMGARP